MSTKNATIGFVAGLVAGAAGMYFGKPDPAPQEAPAPVVAASDSQPEAPKPAATARAESARPRPSTGDAGWWDMDAPRPEIPPSTNGFAMQFASTNGPGGRGERQWDEARMRAEWTNRMAQFATEWSNRVVAARTNFIAKAKLSQDQAVRFDVLVTSMNLRLQDILEPVMQTYQSGGRLTSEDRIRVAHDVSGALVTTYDEMDRGMPEDWRTVASSNEISITQFVDPKYMPFMRGMTGRGGPPGGFGGGRGGPPGGGQSGGQGGQTGGGAQPAAGAAR